jgi:hypothetical protein
MEIQTNLLPSAFTKNIRLTIRGQLYVKLANIKSKIEVGRLKFVGDYLE